MNETQAMPAPGTYFATNNGNGSLADGLALSSLRDGSLDEVTAYAAMDIKHEVWKAESDVQKAIQVQTNLINMNNLSLHNRLCESEKAAIEAKFEAKLEVRDAVDKIKDKIDREAERTNDKLAVFERSTSDNFCALERRLDGKFCDIETRELLSKNACLQAKLEECNTTAQTQAIISAVLSVLSTDTTGVKPGK